MSAHALAHDYKKIEALESIRGIAALLVVFLHIEESNPMLNIRIINNSYLMVGLFFVLSGYVMCSAYLDKINTKKDLFRFQFLRFGRLYPVHIVFLFVYALIELVKYVAFIKLGITSSDGIPFKENNVTAFIKNIFLIQAVLPGKAGTFNYPAWSISVEFYTYLIFGIIILIFRKTKTQVFIFLSFLSLLMLITHYTFGFAPILSCFVGFFIGCLIAIVLNKVTITIPSYISLFIVILLIIFLQIKTNPNYDILIYFITAALIASIVISPKGLLNKFLNFKPLIWLGTFSYSIYMSHASIIWMVLMIFKFVLRRPVITNIINGKIVRHLSMIDSIIAFFVIVVCVLFISAIMYIIIEKPLREKSRSFAFSKIN
jgi:peptidoglycan/LPS O-acetylase OafA/YrhL